MGKVKTRPKGKNRIIVAADTRDIQQAFEWVNSLKGEVGMFKVGFEFILSSFAKLIGCETDVSISQFHMLRQLFQKIGPDLFCDVKIHDIRNTMLGAATGLEPLHAKIINFHASAGKEGMEAVVDSAGDSMSFAVTLLTSLGNEEADYIYRATPETVVKRLAYLAAEAGVDGIICSPKELVMLKADPKTRDLLYATPGVRSAGVAVNDQKRVMTPGECVEAGGDWIVVGRQITDAPDPVAAAKAIALEIEEAEARMALKGEE